MLAKVQKQEKSEIRTEGCMFCWTTYIALKLATRRTRWYVLYALLVDGSRSTSSLKVAGIVFPTWPQVLLLHRNRINEASKQQEGRNQHLDLLLVLHTDGPTPTVKPAGTSIQFQPIEWNETGIDIHLFFLCVGQDLPRSEKCHFLHV